MCPMASQHFFLSIWEKIRHVDQQYSMLEELIPSHPPLSDLASFWQPSSTCMMYLLCISHVGLKRANVSLLSPMFEIILL